MGVAPPFPQLITQVDEGVSFATRRARLIETIHDGQFKIGHATTRIERQERLCLRQGHDLNSRNRSQHRRVDGNQPLAVADFHEVSMSQRCQRR